MKTPLNTFHEDAEKVTYFKEDVQNIISELGKATLENNGLVIHYEYASKNRNTIIKDAALLRMHNYDIKIQGRKNLFIYIALTPIKIQTTTKYLK